MPKTTNIKLNVYQAAKEFGTDYRSLVKLAA